jgi:guanosine-3',5'-bis(diphosphate) 3'-pyrophosphohydrolase
MDQTAKTEIQPLLQAIALAARAHQGQMRKDRTTPYISHPFRVAMIVRNVFGVADLAVLTAAVLHDTLEDTTTDFDDLEVLFGQEVAGWAAALSKDKRLPFAEREDAYCRVLTEAPWQVQVCKLADVFDNLLDSDYLDGQSRLDRVRKTKRYLDAIQSQLKEPARAAWQTVSAMYRELESSLRNSKEEE